MIALIFNTFYCFWGGVLRKQSLLRLTPFPSAHRRGTSISLRKKMGFDRQRRSEDTFENKIPFILATRNHFSSCNQKAERKRRIFWWRGFRLLADRNHIQQKKRKVKTLRLLFKGGRWDSTAKGEARIPLKIKSLLSSQPATTFPLATKKQSAKGAYFDGGDFGCLQTEITYNKKEAD